MCNFSVVAEFDESYKAHFIVWNNHFVCFSVILFSNVDVKVVLGF